MLNGTAEFDDELIGIDEPIPDNAIAYFRVEGDFYARTVYQNKGQSFREYIEWIGIDIDDVKEWWLNHNK